MRIRFLLSVLLLFSTVSLLAQVGINTTTPNAQLEIKSSNEAAPANTDGLIIPKVNAFSAINPTAAQQGMMVYLTTTSGSNAPGFYYWDNNTSTWLSVGNSNSGWALTGNSGTTSLNFLGTTDNKDLVFKRNNIKSGTIESFNASIGVNSLLSNVSGSSNFAFGTDALKNNSIGSANVAMGYSALRSNGIGNENVALGHQALDANAGGNSNVAVGSSSQLFNINGSFNTSIGSESLRENQRSSNTAVGYSSLRSNTFGTNNNAFGSNALINNSIGNFNSAFGDDALRSNLDGGANVALGSSALFSNSSGGRNTAIGFFALKSNIGGLENVAVGSDALGSNTSGSGNVALGNLSLFANQTGNYSTGIGYESLRNNTVGINTAVGYYSLRNNTFGNSNSAFGANALLNNINGNWNSAFGENALINNGGTGNTAFGNEVLKTNTSGSFNTAIGYSADVSNNGLQNATAIGANALVGANNAMVLGSINGVNGAFTDTNVGIGTTTPQDRLHVVGNIRMVDGNQAAGKILTSDANGTASWTSPVVNNVTLDQAYDGGGSGAGRTITADAGAVTINGTDGLVSIGTYNSGALAPSGGATKMVWNPRKAAFRAGRVFFNEWDDTNIGYESVAFGSQTKASGSYSSAFGWSSEASGIDATAFGLGTKSANAHTFAAGYNTQANGILSTVFGDSGIAPSYGETVLGIGATTYTPSSGGNINFQAGNVNDRLFVIGNAIDANANFLVESSERSDALIILKNGLTRLPSTTNAMITAADGKAVVTKEYLQSNTSGTLDQAYDFGGAGLGRTITADAGAVTINGTHGLVSTGTSGSGAVVPSGAGTRMVWNPRKAAFRAGTAAGTEWDDANVGTNSIAMGFGTRAFGYTSVALGSGSSALGMGSIAFGWSATANATQSTAFGLGTNANNIYSTAYGYLTIASGRASTSFGVSNEAQSFGEVVLGIGATSYIPSTNGANQFRTANASDRLFVIGNAIDLDNDDTVDAAERSDAMIVLKNGLTRLPSTTNAMITAADGKAVVTKEYLESNNWSLTGNAGTNATTNFLGTTDNVDMVFRRNNVLSGRLGATNTFFGLSSGLVNTGNYNTFIGQGAGSANATGDDNTFIGRLAGANGASGNENSYLGYAAGLNNTGNSNLILGAFASQNTTGSFNVFVGNLSAGANTTGSRNTVLGFNAELGANNLTNATAIGNNSQVDTSNSLVLGSINGVNGATASTNVGIGTSSPLRALHVSTGASGATPNANADFVVESNGATYQHFLTPSTSETGILFGSNLNSIHSGIIANNPGNTLGLQFRAGGNTTRMTITSAGDVGIGTAAPGGQFELSLNEGRKPTSNTWTIPSDARLKDVHGTYEKGLSEIRQLRTVRYHYKNTDKKIFDEKVLRKEAYGFLAQEVQPLFPEAVGTDADGYLNFDLHPILIASINALKELDAKNNQLQKDNEVLKLELSEQQKKLDYLISEIEKIKNK
ncbi:MAG: tail fiber domain-containing protein [Flavobacteriaceae bacterium]